MSDPKETSVTVEVVYRGIFQKTLAQRICRSISPGLPALDGIAPSNR